MEKRLKTADQVDFRIFLGPPTAVAEQKVRKVIMTSWAFYVWEISFTVLCKKSHVVKN